MTDIGLVKDCKECDSLFFERIFDSCPACSNICGICYGCGDALTMDHKCQEIDALSIVYQTRYLFAEEE